MEGHIRMDGADIYADDVDPPLLRGRFGWIAQKPNPSPWSIRTKCAAYKPLTIILVIVRDQRGLPVLPAEMLQQALNGLDHFLAARLIRRVPVQREMLHRAFQPSTSRPYPGLPLELVGGAAGPEHLIDRRRDMIVAGSN